MSPPKHGLTLSLWDNGIWGLSELILSRKDHCHYEGLSTHKGSCRKRAQANFTNLRVHIFPLSRQDGAIKTPPDTTFAPGFPHLPAAYNFPSVRQHSKRGRE